ncbi:uncharacterized protein LOC115096751 isoform X2 [Rhinatrema bivittatum]|uniref:uncharacterized protein LOC115096751 isoform X2 n=1 Tax=Rhinatrema bivittatum TaxID=194408 RepID=UPI00112A64D6|nr:uncharacterized protein LOC115096751 isoform X2 [Rhinatrema bivittatum]
MGRKRKSKPFTSSPGTSTVRGPTDLHVDRRVSFFPRNIPEISFSSGSPESPGQVQTPQLQMESLEVVPQDTNFNAEGTLPGNNVTGGEQIELGAQMTSESPQETNLSLESIDPQKVTLGDVWKVLLNMQKFLMHSISKFNNVTVEIRKAVDNHEVRLNQVEETIKTMNVQIPAMQASNTTFIKDSLIIHRQLENIENENRKKNFRLLHFPVSRLLSATELFKKYLLEILSITSIEEKNISKIYYAPKTKIRALNDKEEMDEIQRESPNLTSFLEASIDDIPERATLLVSFCSEKDKNLTLQKYFKNKDFVFCGQRIQIFPDVSRMTQFRRKQFLTLKSRVLAIGASFLLRFPCKCSVIYQKNKFTFQDPAHLETFLLEKEVS